MSAPKTPFDSACELAEHGLHVVPAGSPAMEPTQLCLDRCKNDLEKAREAFPKFPLISWRQYQNIQPSEDMRARWHKQWPEANYALITGTKGGVVVVDADTANAVEWICANLPITPWNVKTAKGRHFYYRVDGSRHPAIRNSAGKNKIDIRGAGGYVVIPSSIHSSGVVYEWNDPDCLHSVHISELPILDPTSEIAIQSYNAVPSPANNIVQNFTKPLSECGPDDVWGTLAGVVLPEEREASYNEAQPDGSRNHGAARLAGSYIARGHSLTEVAGFLMDWNETNQPPMDKEEVMHTVASIARTHVNKTGQVIPATPADTVPVSLDPTLPPTPAAAAAVLAAAPVGKYGDKIPAYVSRNPKPWIPADLEFSDDQLESGDYPVREDLWGGVILVEGRVLLAGGAKLGKSAFAYSMAIKLAAGAEFLGIRPARPLRILWLQAENFVQSIASRRETEFNPKDSLTPEERSIMKRNLFVTDRVMARLDDPEGNRKLCDIIDLRDRDLIIIDPLVNFIGANENDNTEMSEILTQIVDAMAADRGIATMVIHHMGKGKQTYGKKDPFDQIRGASSIRGWYRRGYAGFERWRRDLR